MVEAQAQMDEKMSSNRCCPSSGCCKVESLIAIDERGQMVLPKELREKANIRPGDKFALVSWEQGGNICCISLVRVQDLTGIVKDFLAPVVDSIWK